MRKKLWSSEQQSRWDELAAKIRATRDTPAGPRLTLDEGDEWLALGRALTAAHASRVYQLKSRFRWPTEAEKQRAAGALGAPRQLS